MAASRGTNLKKFIEGILDYMVETNDDNKLYTWLTKNVPESKNMTGGKEQKNFEKWLGVESSKLRRMNQKMGYRGS